MKTRGFRDRDFLRTKEGFLFCVVGPYHPKDRVFSYLRYLPSKAGRWGRGAHRFKRAMDVYTIPRLLDTFDLLKKAYPHYLHFSPYYNIAMTAVPHGQIVEHFKGEKTLAALRNKLSLDPLQRKVVGLTSLLSQLSDVSPRNFGVTGSLLVDIHHPRLSDMDITVYGKENSYAVRAAMADLRSDFDTSFRPLEGDRLDKWLQNNTRNHPLSTTDARLILRRKWNTGFFEGTYFSVHPVKQEEELKEKYGDKTYRPRGTATLHAVVIDSKDSIFLPCVYHVKQVELEEAVDANVKEVVSYEGIYDSLAEAGEQIEAKGKLEHVTDSRTGTEYDRVLVGSPEGRGREYIKPIESMEKNRGGYDFFGPAPRK